MNAQHSVTVRILDKDYQVACPEDQHDELMASARYLDRNMREIRNSGKVIGTERIAVMAALNISHELMKTSERSRSVSDESIRALQGKIEDALHQLKQMELN